MSLQSMLTYVELTETEKLVAELIAMFKAESAASHERAERSEEAVQS